MLQNTLRITKKYILFFVFVFATTFAVAQEPVYKLFLVGDAGEDEMAGETLDNLKSKLNTPQSAQSAVIFMGDNSYRNTFFFIPVKGFDSSRVTQRKMRSQLDIVKDYKGSVFFVPGNHDWWNRVNFFNGKKKLKMEESFIEANLKTNPTIANPDSTFLPRNGSPGPVCTQLNNGKVRIVFIDTFWLILRGFKGNPPENEAIEKAFYHNLDSILAVATALKQTVIIVAHHPVYSTGSVATKQLKHPYFLARFKQANETFPSYKTMLDKMNAVLVKYPGVYYASGHIHALQYHLHNGVHYLISGAGSKTSCVKKGEIATEPTETNDYVLWKEKGFFEIDFYKDYSEVILYHENGEKATNLSKPTTAQ